MKSRNPLATMALFLLPLGAALADAGSYQLEANVYVFKPGDFQSLKLPGITGAELPESLLIKSPVTARFDAETLSLKGAEFDWSGGPKPSGRFSQFDIPRLVLVAGQPASLLSSAPVQYLEKRDDGTLEVREIAAKSPEAPHCRLDFTIAPAGANGGELAVTCALDIATVAAREKLPGVTLNVGKPVLAQLARTIDATVRPDEWSGLFVRAPNGSAYSLLLLFKVGPAAGATARAPDKAMTPAELDRFATYYYRHPQPEVIGRVIESLGAGDFLKDRWDVFVGFFAEVFAASPDKVAGWRETGRRQPPVVRELLGAALEWSRPGAILAAPEHSMKLNDRRWGAYFATGNVAYLRRLAGQLSLMDSDDTRDFWAGATAMWSLARNAAEHPAVRPTLVAFRPDADASSRGFIDELLAKDPATIRRDILVRSKARPSTGHFSTNGMMGTGLRDMGDFSPVNPNQELGHNR